MPGEPGLFADHMRLTGRLLFPFPGRLARHDRPLPVRSFPRPANGACRRIHPDRSSQAPLDQRPPDRTSRNLTTVMARPARECSTRESYERRHRVSRTCAPTSANISRIFSELANTARTQAMTGSATTSCPANSGRTTAKDHARLVRGTHELDAGGLKRAHEVLDGSWLSPERTRTSFEPLKRCRAHAGLFRQSLVGPIKKCPSRTDLSADDHTPSP
jgi:hypothetical protein